jgi:hypothetical protein
MYMCVVYREHGTYTAQEAQKVSRQNSRVKTMSTAFFDAKGIVHKESVPWKKTVNVPKRAGTILSDGINK